MDNAHETCREVAGLISDLLAGRSSGAGLASPAKHDAIERLARLARDRPAEYLCCDRSFDEFSPVELCEIGGHAIDQENGGSFYIATDVWIRLRRFLYPWNCIVGSAEHLAALDLESAITLLGAKQVGPALVEQAKCADHMTIASGLDLALMVHTGTGGSDLSRWVSEIVPVLSSRADHLVDMFAGSLSRLATPHRARAPAKQSQDGER